MNLQTNIVNRVTLLNTDPELESKHNQFKELNRKICGWSTFHHYLFFDAVMQSCDNVRVLVCGVYHGMDLAILSECAKRYGRKYTLTGVDLFGNAELADWPPGWKGKKWEEVQTKPVPSQEIAQANCPEATLIKGNSIAYLKEHVSEFDFVYLDTAHDYGTISSEIKAVKAARTRPLVVAGDDYYTIEEPGWVWGVDKACEELLPNHNLLFNRIWIATP